jgi:hypothetical protein
VEQSGKKMVCILVPQVAAPSSSQDSGITQEDRRKREAEPSTGLCRGGVCMLVYEYAYAYRQAEMDLHDIIYIHNICIYMSDYVLCLLMAGGMPLYKCII